MLSDNRSCVCISGHVKRGVKKHCVKAGEAHPGSVVTVLPPFVWTPSAVKLLPSPHTKGRFHLWLLERGWGALNQQWRERALQMTQGILGIPLWAPQNEKSCLFVGWSTADALSLTKNNTHGPPFLNNYKILKKYFNNHLKRFYLIVYLAFSFTSNKKISWTAWKCSKLVIFHTDPPREKQYTSTLASVTNSKLDTSFQLLLSAFVRH